MNNLVLLKVFLKNNFLMLPVSQEFAARLMDGWEKGDFVGKLIKGTCPVGLIPRWALRSDEIVLLHTEKLTPEMARNMGIPTTGQMPLGLPPGASGM